MGMFDTSHKIDYQRGLVDKDIILDLISQVEKFPDEEYGDYGEVLEHTDYCIYAEIADAIIDADVVEAIPKDQYEQRLKADMVVILNKIRAEILDCLKALDDIEKSGVANYIYLPNEMSGRRLTYQQCLEFIDKYMSESEEKECG